MAKAISKSSKELKQELESTKTDVATFNPSKELGETRSRIAKQFVFWYFIVLCGSFVLSLIYNLIILFLCNKEQCQQAVIIPKDILITVMGIVGSPLGFIVGYYFKDIEKK